MIYGTHIGFPVAFMQINGYMTRFEAPKKQPFINYYLKSRHAPVAQLDRASDFESAGRGFESLRARHFLNGIKTDSVSYIVMVNNMFFLQPAGRE